MRVLDLFSGIGGFSLGLERAGMTTVAFCEVDPFCRQVLRKHWPETPIHDDIRELDGRQYRGTADVVCGGFPCQPYSHAGKQRGAADDRHLWPEMLRVIREVEPRFVIGENVPGIIGMELDQVLSDLEALGYACGAFVIPAAAVDAHHRRDRLWILGGRDREPDQSVDAQASRSAPADVAHAHDDGNGISRKRRSVCHELGQRTPQELKQHDIESRVVRRGENVADSDSDSGERLKSRKSDAQGRAEPKERPLGSCGDGAARWSAEPCVGRVVDGLSAGVDRSARLRALGNAVVPQVVEQIGLAVMEAA